MSLRTLAVAIHIAMPNPQLTPGDVLPVTAAQVCVPGYSSKVRHVTTATKRKVFELYDVKYEPGKYEVDHLVSLELGGSNDIKNLWPEPYEPRPGAREKDEVENYLHREVCAGRLPLAEAQRRVKDWWPVYQSLHPDPLARR